jgi:serine/threonine protein kinase
MSPHQNVLDYYEGYRQGKNIYIIMELMECSLTDLVQSFTGKIAEHLIAYIVREVLTGLAFLHGEYRIHRDLKSDNVMTGQSGEVKLGDFGFAA